MGKEWKNPDMWILELARTGEALAEINKYDDLLHVIKITDPDTTMGEVVTQLAAVNTAGDHVVFDVSALSTGMYLVTIYLSSQVYRVCDLVTGYTGTGVFSSGDLLADILAGSSNAWALFKAKVDAGTAPTDYAVGSQLTDKWYKDANTGYDAVWDVCHYDSGGNCYIKWHYAWPDAFAFDEPEAIYYFDGTEEAGVEYYILIKTAYGEGWAANAGIAFTLTDTPEAGDQLVLATATNANTDPTNVTWRVYDAGGTTVKQTGTTSSSTTGTKLGETSSSGVGYTNGRVNAPQRVVYGYGRWSQSAMRQWMNSALGAGAWWSPQNPWDRPPAVAATIRGFMAGLSLDFLSIVEKTTVTTALNTVAGLQEDRETTEDYFFLPSLQEMYVTTQLADAEGVDWDYFKELAADAGLSGRFATHPSTYAELITYNLSNTSSPVYVRLRSATRGYTYYAWYVSTTGYVNYGYAYYGFRGCPACKIRKS